MAVTPKAGMKPGVTIRIGGGEYIAPQLNFGAIRGMREIPGAPKGPNDKGDPTYAHDLMAFVLLKSLQRNYDGIDAQWLNDTLEGSEVDEAAVREVEILRASGLIPRENTASGEANAATE